MAILSSYKMSCQICQKEACFGEFPNDPNLQQEAQNWKVLDQIVNGPHEMSRGLQEILGRSVRPVNTNYHGLVQLTKNIPFVICDTCLVPFMELAQIEAELKQDVHLALGADEIIRDAPYILKIRKGKIVNIPEKCKNLPAIEDVINDIRQAKKSHLQWDLLQARLLLLGCAGLDYSKVKVNGLPPLQHLLSMNKDEYLIAELIDQSDEFYQTIPEQTIPLHPQQVVSNNYRVLSAAKLMVMFGATADQLISTENDTMLFRLCRENDAYDNYMASILSLLRLGADADFLNRNGESALNVSSGELTDVLNQWPGFATDDVAMLKKAGNPIANFLQYEVFGKISGEQEDDAEFLFKLLLGQGFAEHQIRELFDHGETLESIMLEPLKEVLHWSVENSNDLTAEMIVKWIGFIERSGNGHFSFEKPDNGTVLECIVAFVQNPGALVEGSEVARELEQAQTFSIRFVQGFNSRFNGLLEVVTDEVELYQFSATGQWEIKTQSIIGIRITKDDVHGFPSDSESMVELASIIYKAFYQLHMGDSGDA